MATRPTGTVSFLFTDIEGSSRLWRDAPSEMSASLARHDRIIRNAIERGRGHIFSTRGDGFAAAFGRAGDAVEAARAGQAALGEEDWPPGAVIRVRMGIHTGEVEERDGDYFGPPVNHAARIMALGRGGQVLLSAVTADLLGSPEGLTDLGEHVVPDSTGPARIYALTGPGLGTDAPATVVEEKSDEAPGPGTIFSFGPVEVNVAAIEVRRDGEVVPVEPQVFDVLRHLIEHRDRVVPKEELLDQVWGDRFVSESALTSRIRSARLAIGDDGRRQEIIRTVHGRGYQFIADVDVSSPVAAPATGGTVPVTGTAIQGLPLLTRPLVGRSDELTELNDLIDGNRLVTILGPGGVGKTRLATEMAARWAEDRGIRVVFVPLSPVADPEMVGSAMTDAFGLRFDAGPGPVGLLCEALRGQDVLVVLDNFEHVSDASPLVLELLESIAGLRILVTSRERLRLVNEQVFELHPLDIGSSDGLAATNVESAPAVALFEQAARATTPGFAVTAENIADVAAVCHMLDGLPLAVELAAAQLRYLPIAYLRTHLESNAAHVADEARDRPDRHRTVGDTVAWSHALLTPTQQRLFTTLSVFAGEWSLAGAVAVAGDDDAEVLTGLAALVDKSLVRPAGDRRGDPRWTMLHVIREYASRMLAASGTDARLRHAEYVAGLVEAADVTRSEIRADTWVDDLIAEFADIRAALQWTFDHGEPVLGCRIVGALNLWWYRSTRHREGRRWVARALEHVEDLDPATASRVHIAAGYLAYGNREMEQSYVHFEQALGAAQQVEDASARSLALCGLAAASIGRPERYDRAQEVFREGIGEARRLGDRTLVAHGLNELGELLRSGGDLDGAEAAYREALEINEALGDLHYQAINLANLGHVALARGDVQAALPFMRAGLDMSVRVGSRTMAAWSVSEKALPYQMTGQPERAARLIGGAEAALELLGVQRGPADQPVHEMTREALMQDLGRARFDELVLEGRQMTLDQAIDLALEGLAGLQSRTVGVHDV